MDCKNTVQKVKVIATWYLEAGTKMNSTLTPGNSPIHIIVIKRGYCFVFCIFIVDHKTHLLLCECIKKLHVTKQYRRRC